MENILINIDSQNRDIVKYADPGYFIYVLPETIKNISFIRLASIELPTLFYTFLNQYNNTTFRIILNNNSNVTIVIKEGNYQSSTIITTIQSQLNTINTNFVQDFTITWDSINYKIKISNSAAFSLIFDNDPTYRSLGNRLGFRGSNSSYLYDTQVSSIDPKTQTLSYHWQGETFLDVTKDEYLYLRINDYGVIYNYHREKTLLAKIILYDQQFVIDNGANFLTKMYNFRQPINLSKLEIELISSLGARINMNLIDFSMTLECGQIYDSTKKENYNFDLSNK
jgi:hypothetical protein